MWWGRKLLRVSVYLGEGSLVPLLSLLWDWDKDGEDGLQGRPPRTGCGGRAVSRGHEAGYTD